MGWGKTSGRGNPALALLSTFSLLAGSASGQDSIFDDGFETGDGSAWTMTVPALPVYLLSQTGLYANIVDKDLAPGVELFGVLFELWVDGADQQRFALLPPGVQIDSGLMGDWSLPVGTRLWKEVSDGGVRLWTEYIERWGNGPNDFIYAAYIWNADESEGFLELAGQDDVRCALQDVGPRRNANATTRNV